MNEYKSFYSLNPDNGWQDKNIKLALRFLDNTSLIHNEKETEWKLIQDLFKTTFEIKNSKGTKKISSKLLYQCLSKIISKQKFLDFQLHGSQRDELVEKLATDGVSTVLDNGNFSECFRNKGGVFWKADLFGDAFIQMGTQKNNSVPIQYRVCSLSDSYVDNNANGIRDVVGGNSSTEFLYITRFSEDAFFLNYPEMKEKVGCGEIPRTLAQWKQLEKTTNQALSKDKMNMIEVAYYYNINHKIYSIFAGSRCTPMYEWTGKNYPFIKKGKDPFIPIYHFFFEPSCEGFYNYGIGHILYDLANVLSQMDNMAVNHAEDNIYPINFLNVPEKAGAKVMQQINMANKQRALGLKPYAIHEYNPNAQNSQLSLNPMQSQPITEEWERLFTRLEKIITRMGFQLDAIDRGSSYTATQVLAEEENADSFVKQIMEYNASESKDIVEDTIELMKTQIDDYNDTPVNSTTKIDLPDGSTKKIDGITLGMVSDELKKYNYFVEINARSGSIPSNLMQQAQISKSLALAQPGTMAFNKLAVKAMKLNNQDISEEDLMHQGMPQQGQAGIQEGAEQLPQGGTETNEMQAKMANSKDFMQVPV